MRFSPLTIFLIVLAFLLLGGGHYGFGGQYAPYGYGGGGFLLLVVLLIMLL